MSSLHLLKAGGLFLALVLPGQPTGDLLSHPRGLAGRRGEHGACQRARDDAHSNSGLRAAGTRHCGCAQFSLEGFERSPSTSASGRLLNLECASPSQPLRSTVKIQTDA